jgi:hypothetical protein
VCVCVYIYIVYIYKLTYSLRITVLKLRTFLITAAEVTKLAHTAFIFPTYFVVKIKSFTWYLALAPSEVTLVQNLTYFSVLPNNIHRKTLPSYNQTIDV